MPLLRLKKAFAISQLGHEAQACLSLCRLFGQRYDQSDGSHRRAFGYIGWRALHGALSMTPDILVKNVALWGSEGLCDVEIANGRIVSIGGGNASRSAALTL